MSESNLILTLKATTIRAEKAFSLAHNKDRYVGPPSDDAAIDIWSRESTPATNVGDDERRDFGSQLHLTFDRKPKNMQQGFVFGSDPIICDVLLGRARDRISGRHFSITFDDQNRLVLNATSRWRMTVSYNGQGERQGRKHSFTWILFPKPTKIEVRIDKDLRFEVELAEHKPHGDEYRRRINSFLEESRNAIAPFSLLGIYSQETTAAPTQPLSPTLRPIYYMDEELGRGVFGRVHKVIDVSTGRIFAGKYFLQGKWEREVRIMGKVSHEHVVQFIDFTEEVQPCLVMEYLSLGNLLDQHGNTPLAEVEVIILLYQGLQALEYLHSHKVTHRDIKPANILCQSRTPFHIKLTDFGLSKDGSFLLSCVGTQLYAAPEIWEGFPYTPAVDIWSLGLVVFECVYGLPEPGNPFRPQDWYPKIGRRIRESGPDHLKDFLSAKMLTIYQKRLPASGCLEEAFNLYMLRATLPAQNFQDEVGTPTEKMSSSNMMEALRNRDEQNPAEGVETNIDHPAVTSEKSLQVQTQIWGPSAAVAYQLEPDELQQPTTKSGQKEASLSRQLKRRHHDKSDFESRSWQLYKAQGLREDEVGCVFISVEGKIVSMRKSDYWLNATQIIVLAGKTDSQRKYLLRILKTHTTVDVAPRTQGNGLANSWVPYRDGHFLCKALQLTERLKLLLQFGQERTGFDMQKVGQDNYFNDYFKHFKVPTDRGEVFVRRADFWINATHLLREAGKDRHTIFSLRRCKELKPEQVDVVKGGPSSQGTYVDVPTAFRLCDKYGLEKLKPLLQTALKENGYQHGGLKQSVVTTNARTMLDAETVVSLDSPPIQVEEPEGKSQEICPDPLPSWHDAGSYAAKADLNIFQSPHFLEETDLSPENVARLSRKSVFTEASYKDGSYFQPINRSFLEQVHP